MTSDLRAARVIVHTGKGGVGKTSVAAATAVRLASGGQRTLVASTDVAHSLADVLDHPLGDRPTPVRPDLDAQQLSPDQRLRSGWRDIGEYLRAMLTWGGADPLESAELAVLPGLDELFALLDLHDHARSGRYDVIVVDCAPTAETLRLLRLPEVLGWYVERLLPVQRHLTRALRPAVGRITTMPVPDDGVFASVRTLYDRLQAVRGLLLDAAHTSVRMVVTADRVVLAEARRMLTSLYLFGHHVDAVVVNRLVPERVTDPFLRGWRERQQGLSAEIVATFGAIPRLPLELQDGEPVGLERLATLGDRLFERLDPAAVLHDGPRLEIERNGDGHVLRLPLPATTSSDAELLQRGDELYITVGGYTRNVMLPAALRTAGVTSARVTDGWLVIVLDAADQRTGAVVDRSERVAERAASA
ncbi:MAG TPA: ArsA family ATPase [Euzebyales bacterium]